MPAPGAATSAARRDEPGRERFLPPLFHMNCQAVALTCAILTASCLALPERFSPRRCGQSAASRRRSSYLGVCRRCC
jgi:hypothetical protein